MNEHIERWLQKAENDLRVAEHEMHLPDKERITEAICFHCQLAVEKYLKAYLIAFEINFNDTHDLALLLNLCAKQDQEFSSLHLGNLSFYAIEIKYPDDFYSPTTKEARESIKIAKTVKELVLKKLQKE